MPTFSELTRSLSSRRRKLLIERVIQQRLTFLHFAPGEQLIEEALADEFGVSRTPIREICHRLEAQGSLVFVRQQGFFAPAITAESVRAFHQAAPIIMSTTYAMAAARLTPAQHLELRSLAEAMSQPSSDDNPNAFLDLALRFNLKVADACGNPYLAGLCAQLAREKTRIVIYCVRTVCEHGQCRCTGPEASLVSRRTVSVILERRIDGVQLAVENEIAGLMTTLEEALSSGYLDLS